MNLFKEINPKFLTMKNLSYFLTSLLMVVLLGSCQGNQNQQNNQEKQPETSPLEQSVLSIHDSTMMLMDPIHHLKNDLQDQLTSVDSTDTATINTIHAKMKQLEAANEAMMDWMHQFKKPADSISAEADKYLQEQKVKVEAVKTQMDSAISKAKQLLTKLKTEKHEE